MHSTESNAISLLIHLHNHNTDPTQTNNRTWKNRPDNTIHTLKASMRKNRFFFIIISFFYHYMYMKFWQSWLIFVTKLYNTQDKFSSLKRGFPIHKSLQSNLTTCLWFDPIINKVHPQYYQLNVILVFVNIKE
jgi:hypothetical protein